MNRRVVAAVVAAVMALAGLGLISKYVAGADARALAGVETRSVYVVGTAVPKGTDAAALAASVEKRLLPAAGIPQEAVTDLNQVTGRVTSTDLVPGEVLIQGRFVDPALLDRESVQVPKGMQTVSFLLPPQQVNGGVVQAGDKIGIIFGTRVKTDGGGTNPAEIAQKMGIQTDSGVLVAFESEVLAKQVLDQVLVTRVQGAVIPASTTKKDGETQQAAPSDGVLVTVAVTTAQAEKLAWGQAMGTYMLVSVQNKDTDTSSSKTTTGKVVYQK